MAIIRSEVQLLSNSINPVYYKFPCILDVDECAEENGGCEQICENTYGSFRCLCDEGFGPGYEEGTCSG